MADKLKLLIAALLVAAGVAGFYLLAAYPAVLRVLAVLAGMGLAAALAYFTEAGKAFASFSRESWLEAKKVVWPTRKETVQSTSLVIGFVVVMAIFLWLVDAGLAWVVRLAMGQGA